VPELPEVETTRRQLEPLLLGRRVERVEHDAPHKYLQTHLAHGRRVRSLGRRGKYLIASFESEPDEPDVELVVHLGMTGGFRPELSRHTRVTLHLDDGSRLYFQDARRFGKWAVIPSGRYSGMPTLAAMGPEPLGEDFDEAAFVALAARAGAVKPWLLSQVPVAGVGNIYADESLWRARIHPAQTRLTPDEARRLHAAIREVLAEAVLVGGSTLSDHTYAQPDGTPGGFQTSHHVYAREGHACARCGGAIVKTVLAARGTHFCPACQPLRAPSHPAEAAS
jgi:formamidopyrimidine-DNA glycosylase